MSTPYVYLAGPITGLTYADGQEWRDYAIKELATHAIEARSPLRGKSYLREQGELAKEDYGHIHPLSSDKGIVTRDRNDTINAALVIANLLGAKRISGGTCIELGWADIARVPTIVVMEPNGVNPHDAHMVRGVAGFVMHTLDAAIDLAATVMGHDLDLEHHTA
jgi:nucleoside 2-deoxyribosyltransferase